MPTIYNITLIPDIVTKAKGSHQTICRKEQTMASLSDSKMGVVERRLDLQ